MIDETQPSTMLENCPHCDRQNFGWMLECFYCGEPLDKEDERFIDIEQKRVAA